MGIGLFSGRFFYILSVIIVLSILPRKEDSNNFILADIAQHGVNGSEIFPFKIIMSEKFLHPNSFSLVCTIKKISDFKIV